MLPQRPARVQARTPAALSVPGRDTLGATVVARAKITQFTFAGRLPSMLGASRANTSSAPGSVPLASVLHSPT
jgi:hypothetical protein